MDVETPVGSSVCSATQWTRQWEEQLPSHTAVAIYSTCSHVPVSHQLRSSQSSLLNVRQTINDSAVELLLRQTQSFTVQHQMKKWLKDRSSQWSQNKLDELLTSLFVQLFISMCLKTTATTNLSTEESIKVLNWWTLETCRGGWVSIHWSICLISVRRDVGWALILQHRLKVSSRLSDRTRGSSEPGQS